jgi:hypothetical protein
VKFNWRVFWKKKNKNKNKNKKWNSSENDRGRRRCTALKKRNWTRQTDGGKKILFEPNKEIRWNFLQPPQIQLLFIFLSLPCRSSVK